MLTLYKVGNEKETRLNFETVSEVDMFLNGVYDSVKGAVYSDGILYNCYTTIMSTWKRSDWILSKCDAMGDKIEVKDWN